MDDAATDGSDGESRGDKVHDSDTKNKRQKLADERPADEKEKDNETTTSASSSTPHRRYMMIVAYDGTRFKGFQRQTSSSSSSSSTTDPSTSGDKQVLRKTKVRRHDWATGKVLAVSVTVQELLEDALEMFAGPNWNRDLLKMRFAGRTDAGVHARGQVIAVTLPIGVVRKASLTVSSNKGNSSSNQHSKTNDDGKEDCDDGDDEMWAIRRGINSRLPVDISIERVQVAPHHDFNPRNDAKRKQYSYTLRYRRQVPSTSERESILPVCAQGGPHLLRSALDPMNGQCWIVPWPLDDSCLGEYCQVLTGTHDFSAFVHKSSRIDQLDNNRTVERFDMERIRTVEEDGAAICTVRFTTEAKGFGRHQVRYMVGFLVDLCRGKSGALAPDIRPVASGERVADWLWNGDQDYDRLAASIQKAAPCGLILEKVYF